jgi:3-hydroxyacyl-[acyl-carrier-protein] dehydratase
MSTKTVRDRLLRYSMISFTSEPSTYATANHKIQESNATKPCNGLAVWGLALRTSLKMNVAPDHLPHGPEFRFLDAVTELDPGKSGAGHYTVRGDEPFLRGHFPGEPIFPGVLLVEAAAQLAGCVAQSDPGIPPLRDLKLTAIRNAKITGTARPRQTIRLTATILARMRNLVQASAVATVDGVTVLQAELTLAGANE